MYWNNLRLLEFQLKRKNNLFPLNKTTKRYTETHYFYNFLSGLLSSCFGNEPLWKQQTVHLEVRNLFLLEFIERLGALKLELGISNEQGEGGK